MSLRSLALLVIAIVLTALSGCNTVRGAGEDIESAGKAIKKSTY